MSSVWQKWEQVSEVSFYQATIHLLQVRHGLLHTSLLYYWLSFHLFWDISFLRNFQIIVEKRKVRAFYRNVFLNVQVEVRTPLSVPWTAYVHTYLFWIANSPPLTPVPGPLFTFPAHITSQQSALIPSSPFEVFVILISLKQVLPHDVLKDLT